MNHLNSSKQYLKLYLASLAFVWKKSGKIVLFLLLAIPLQALLPSFTIYVTNHMLNSLAKQELVVHLLIVWGLAFLLANLVTPFITMIQGKLTDLLTYAINQDLMEQSSCLPSISYFEDSEFYNDIEFLTQEASWRPVNLLVFGTSLISNGLLFLSMLALFYSFHPLMSLALFLAILPHAYLSYKIQQEAFEVLVSNSEESRKLEYYSSRLLTEESIKEVKLFNLYPFFMKKYKETFRAILFKVEGSRKKRFYLTSIFLVFTTAVSILAFAYVLGQVQRSQLELGSILIFSSSSLYAMTAMSRLVEDSSLLYDTLLYMEKFFHFTSIETEDKEGVSLDEEFRDLQISHLFFTYPKQEEGVLKNIDLTIHKGEKIALVGENGAGKSTLVKLLLNFYPLENGEIKLNGRPIRTIQKEAYAKYFSAIFQDFARFDLSLKENIIISDLDAQDEKERLEAAILDSGLDQSWLTSLDQVLGRRFDQSKDLSGGQWQKVALARAFFSQAPFLILDEPTASLDARTEYELFQKFLDLTKDKTVIFITHRLSSVKQADKILLLKDGQIEAVGPHDQLLKTSPYYRELYDMQASLYE